MGSRSEARARARAIRTRRIEAIALGVLAILPIVPYLTFLMRSGVPRFGLFGDQALLEQATRHVWSGDTLLGPHSRFAFSHPGPLFFYLAAPFQAIFGSASTGLYIGTCIVNATAAFGLGCCARLFARRPHAIATLLVVLGWFVAFGNLTANPWSPLIVVLPLMAFLLNAAMLARGKSGAIYPVVFFGALAFQTHVAVVTTIIAIGVVSLVAFFVGARRRGGLDRRDRWRMAIAAAMMFVFFVPPLVEQILAPTGNIRRLFAFFVHREAPLKPLSVATMHWTTATSWLPERLFGRTLLIEGSSPLPMRADTLADGVTSNARLIAIIHVMAVAIAAILAARRRDVVSLSLLAMGAIADAIAVTALQAIVGTSYLYLAFWTTAASSIAWIGVFAALFSGIGALANKVPRIAGVIAPALIIIGLSAAVTTASFQRFWLAKNPTPPSSHPELRVDLRALLAGVRARTQKDGTIAVMHREAAKDIADGLVLELEKDGVDVRTSNADHDVWSGVRTANGVAKPLHVYFASPSKPLKSAPCLELIVKSGDLSVYGGPIENPTCPEAK